MSDLEYILSQAKKSHFTGWDAKELRKCLDMIPNLSREDLFKLYRSKWIDDGKSIKETVFDILFTSRLGIISRHFFSSFASHPTKWDFLA